MTLGQPDVREGLNWVVRVTNLLGTGTSANPKGLPTSALKAGDECRATARDALPEAEGTSSDKAPAFCLALACHESRGCSCR